MLYLKLKFLIIDLFNLLMPSFRDSFELSPLLQGIGIVR